MSGYAQSTYGWRTKRESLARPLTDIAFQDGAVQVLKLRAWPRTARSCAPARRRLSHRGVVMILSSGASLLPIVGYLGMVYTTVAIGFIVSS